VIDHCTEGHLIAKELGKWKARAVVGPTLSCRCKPELKNKSFETVKTLLDEGCVVAITTDHPVVPIEALSVCASMCVRYGLDEERAIKAITEYPALILGLDKKLGKIETGFDADVVIWNGHPLDSRSKPDQVFINGHIID
jgi:imidazolonepropionase-like amidohydrolase